MQRPPPWPGRRAQRHRHPVARARAQPLLRNSDSVKLADQAMLAAGGDAAVAELEAQLVFAEAQRVMDPLGCA